MYRIIAAGSVMVALAAAGCGSASKPTRPAAAVTTTAAVKAVPVKTAQQSDTGFFDMKLLGSDIRRQEAKRLADDPESYGYTVGTTARTVTCIQMGRQGATCLGKFTDGTTETSDVTIANDGLSYISK